VQHSRVMSTDNLEERGQGAGRLLGEGAEEAFTDDEAASPDTPETPDEDELPDGSGPPDNHQADES
jgi:hypothetical protein